MASRKETAWLHEYLQCWNATEAARRAGYKWPNKQGPRKLEKFAVEIQARLDEMKLGADEVLRRLGEQARAEYSDYLNDDGTIDLPRLLADGKGHLVRGTRYDRQGRLIVDFYDAQSALVHLGRHHKLFIDKHEIDLDGGIVVKKVSGIDV